MILDDWQKEVLATKGNICLRSGRQVGKSTVISIKAAEYARTHPNSTILVVASVERQAYLLFEKILNYLHDNHKNCIRMGKYRPTKHKINLKNKSVIWCLPTGLSGSGIRGYTINLLIADEAAFIPEEVWTAVSPMLTMTGGDIWLLSTPAGKEGHFYRCFEDDAYSKFHIRTEDILKYPNRSEIQKESLKHKLEEDKKWMTKLQYAQEYYGEFVDELRQFFPTELIKSCLVLSRSGEISSPSRPAEDTFLGVDVARMGGDESVMISLNRKKKDFLKMVDMKIMTEHLLTDLVREIKQSDAIWHYKRIYIDDGGMGVGIFDPLLEDEQTKRKVEAINNARRSLDVEERPQRKKLMKEDLYNNLLSLMEKGKIALFNEPEIFLSLKSIQMEYTEGRLKIFGTYTHIAEALIRAAWCMKDKHLNIWIKY